MKFYRENQINPAASCLPMLAQFPVFIALYYALRNFSHEPASQHPGSLSFLHFIPSIADHTTSHWGGFVLLVVYVAIADGVDALHVGDRRQDAADHLHAHAARLRVRDRALPGGPRSLLGDDEPLDGRSGADHAAARAEDTGRGSSRRRRSRTPPKDDGSRRQRREAPSPTPPKPAPARSQQPPRKVRRKKKAGRR